MTAAEIAGRINAHLKATEADKTWNLYDYTDRKGRTVRLSKLYNARAYAGKSKSVKWIWLTYISYQGRAKLSKDEAATYLAWLDAGNRGTHYEQQREVAA